MSKKREEIMPVSHSPQELEDALHHIAYEHVALRSAFQLCFRPTSAAAFAAAFEPFVLHYRTLVEFFHHDKDKRRLNEKADLRAQDYVPDWKTPTLPSWAVWREKIHALLAHLSTERNPLHARKAGLNHERDFPSMLTEVESGWSAWVGGLSGPHASLLSEALRLHDKNFGTGF